MRPVSLNLLLLQYTSSLDLDPVEAINYKYKEGDILIDPRGSKIVDINSAHNFAKWIIRDIDDKDKTEIFYGARLDYRKVHTSNGNCRKHKNFKKIIDRVNAMRQQNQS